MFDGNGDGIPDWVEDWDGDGDVDVDDFFIDSAMMEEGWRHSQAPPRRSSTRTAIIIVGVTVGLCLLIWLMLIMQGG